MNRRCIRRTRSSAAASGSACASTRVEQRLDGVELIGRGTHVGRGPPEPSEQVVERLRGVGQFAPQSHRPAQQPELLRPARDVCRQRPPLGAPTRTPRGCPPHRIGGRRCATARPTVDRRHDADAFEQVGEAGDASSRRSSSPSAAASTSALIGWWNQNEPSSSTSSVPESTASTSRCRIDSGSDSPTTSASSTARIAPPPTASTLARRRVSGDRRNHDCRTAELRSAGKVVGAARASGGSPATISRVRYGFPRLRRCTSSMSD